MHTSVGIRDAYFEDGEQLQVQPLCATLLTIIFSQIDGGLDESKASAEHSALR